MRAQENHHRVFGLVSGKLQRIKVATRILPKTIHIVLSEERIRSDDRHSVLQRRGDNEPVVRVLVMMGQFAGMGGDLEVYGDLFHAVLF